MVNFSERWNQGLSIIVGVSGSSLILSLPKEGRKVREEASGKGRALCLDNRMTLEVELQRWSLMQRRVCFYRLKTSLNVKVLDFIQLGGPILTIGRTVFEMWLGSL